MILRQRIVSRQPTEQPDHPAPVAVAASTRAHRPLGDAVQRRVPHLPSNDKVRRTNLPPDLASGIESVSGVSMDGVRVHYNSAAPTRVDALAYTQGRAIHVAPGQERHLAHEAWHVVQQAQGRVRATRQLAGGVAVNDSDLLEREADAMGSRALAAGRSGRSAPSPLRRVPATGVGDAPKQLKCGICSAKSHSTAKCPKAEKSEGSSASSGGRGQSVGDKHTRAQLETLLDEIGDSKYGIYGEGAKSLIGGYKGKRSSLSDTSARIDRQGKGNVQFQTGGATYATVVFPETADVDDVMAALMTSHNSGKKVEL